MDVTQDTGVELAGDAAAAALSAAFARLMTPQPVQHITLRDMRVMKGPNRRWQVRLVFKRAQAKAVEEITFGVTASLARWMRKELAVIK